MSTNAYGDYAEDDFWQQIGIDTSDISSTLKLSTYDPSTDGATFPSTAGDASTYDPSTDGAAYPSTSGEASGTDDNYGREGQRTSMKGVGTANPSAYQESSGVSGIIKSASSWLKDNKELASVIGSGIVGAVKDKNTKDALEVQRQLELDRIAAQKALEQQRIDYLKEKQAALNSSVKSYTRNPNLKV